MYTETKKWERYMITAALPYANGPLHIGHLAGAYLPSDIYVRYLKSKNREVCFVCGTDEHGVAITIKAAKENKNPKEIVDLYHKSIKVAFEEMGIHFDYFSRTSNLKHHENASDFFLKFYQEGKFEEIESDQYFDPQSNQFLADRYIIGICPKCSNPGAYGDQCEKCGSSLNPSDLIDPRSAISGAKPELRKTIHWFFPLNKYQDQLENYILEGHKEWKPNVYGQCKSWLVNDGLQPRAMTRDLNWGVKVPIEGAESKVLYVWFDAPLGYITATKEWAESKGKPDLWKKFWLKDHSEGQTRLIHFIGKDNIVFHCIIFPAILMADGNYILPDNVPANEFLNLEGEKISTSRNWAVWVNEFLNEFPGKADVLRYVLTATMPESKDNDFTWKDFQDRNNNELVAIFGNFINRVVVLTEKFFNGIVPEPGTLHEYDRKILEAINIQADNTADSIEKFRFREALANAMDLARQGNKYLADLEPWKLIKSDQERTGTVLYVSLQLTAALAVLMEPFLPFTSHKINQMLGIGKLSWEDLKTKTLIFSGHKIENTGLLFEKIEDEQVAFQLSKLKKEEPKVQSITSEPIKPVTDFDLFSKMDLRTARIISAEKVEGTDKLLKITLDLGFEQRTVVSGIAKHFSPEQLPGTMVTLLANLAPRRIKGIESNGMILMAEDSKGRLFFVNSESASGLGSVIK